MEFYGFTAEQAEEAVAKYRERFQNTGIFENEVYAGIPEMLKNLQSNGYFLAVASSKPQVYVERILEHFDLKKYFAVVVGSELDGRQRDEGSGGAGDTASAVQGESRRAGSGLHDR
ncbi:MAG: HAD hydrolase-like protein [Lachnospiraceae bacterium]